MVYFHAQNPNLGIFWRALEWIILLYFISIWNILWQFGIILLVIFVYLHPFWYVVPRKKNLATLTAHDCPRPE
jgi:hypothetical protein